MPLGAASIWSACVKADGCPRCMPLGSPQAAKPGAGGRTDRYQRQARSDPGDGAEALVGTAAKDVAKALAPGGHIGLFMDRHTLTGAWPKIGRWILDKGRLAGLTSRRRPRTAVWNLGIRYRG